MADGHLSAVEAMHNFDMPAFYENWVTLMADDDIAGQVGGMKIQWKFRILGGFFMEISVDTIPYFSYGSRPGDPAWTAAFPIVAYELYRYA